MTTKNFVPRELRWHAGRIVTQRWRVCLGLAIAAVGGNRDAHGSPWWAMYGALTIAVVVIAWPSLREIVTRGEDRPA